MIKIYFETTTCLNYWRREFGDFSLSNQAFPLAKKKIPTDAGKIYTIKFLSKITPWYPLAIKKTEIKKTIKPEIMVNEAFLRNPPAKSNTPKTKNRSITR